MSDVTIAPFLDGGGRAAEKIRAVDWSTHALGPPDQWPDALCAAISLVVNSPEPMILCWGEDLWFFFNDAYFPLLGPRLPWAMGARFDQVWADAVDQARPIIAAAMAGRSEHFTDVPWKLATDRGPADTWWSFSYSRILDRNGQPVGLFIFANETTERVASDAALARSQAELTAALVDLQTLNHTLEERVSERTAERNLLATILETTDAIVHVLDTDYRWLAMNRAGADEFERLFGVRPQIGDDVLAAVGDRAEDAAAIRESWARAFAGEEYTTVAAYGDDRQGGERRTYSIKFGALRDERDVQVGAYMFATDITDRLRAETELHQAHEALRQSQKMEAMGQLTGGVAHDFNNLLTPIMGSLDLLQRRGTLSEREARLVDGALQSAERARTLVQRLLAFARRQPLQPGPVDVAALIDGMADLIASTSGPQIRVHVDVRAALPPAHADANQLEMAILNLCVNARDAMPDGGALTIAADLRDVTTGEVAGLEFGRYVRLSVADTGTGMDADVAARAIEPFFSTKGIGKGTGLGLSMVHGLAMQLGGAMDIATRPGLGTRVDLWLPISATMPGAAREAEAAPASFRGRALVVDDEALVRISTADMLRGLGYETEEVDNATDAERRLHAAPHGFDLVVTDHLMPGRSGAWLAAKIRETWPALPVLIVSGYAEVEGVAPDIPRLAKPFREVELAQAIAALAP